MWIVCWHRICGRGFSWHSVLCFAFCFSPIFSVVKPHNKKTSDWTILPAGELRRSGSRVPLWCHLGAQVHRRWLLIVLMVMGPWTVWEHTKQHYCKTYIYIINNIIYSIIYIIRSYNILYLYTYSILQLDAEYIAAEIWIIQNNIRNNSYTYLVIHSYT